MYVMLTTFYIEPHLGTILFSKIKYFQIFKFTSTTSTNKYINRILINYVKREDLF